MNGLQRRLPPPSLLAVSHLCLTSAFLAWLTEVVSKHKHLSDGRQRGSQLISHLIIFPKVFLVCHLSPYLLQLSPPPSTLIPEDFQPFCLPLSRLLSLPVVTFDPTQLTCVSGTCLSKMAFFVFVCPLVTVGPFSG